MKKILFISILSIGWMSCGSSKEKMLSDAQIHAKADSLIGVKMESMNQQSMEDLDHRISIEVKAKADSIVQARTAVDTTKKTRKN